MSDAPAQPPPSSPSPPPHGNASQAAAGWLVRAFAWHLRGFVAANIALNIVNAVTGRPWWAFWPLVVTGLLFGLHYLAYKTATVDESWAAERVEELNLKSYDRSHIEDLRHRYQPDKGGEERGP
jgi:hypothetical protein